MSTPALAKIDLIHLALNNAPIEVYEDLMPNSRLKILDTIRIRLTLIPY
jgi:hypothetical protein